tara:strand:+ start:80438 stop:82354 length:1917 start_codon:yes stop_codon:yes gene_type:complete
MFVLLGLFIGMMSFVSNNTQTFLDKQLTKNAKDTATSLGLSLSLAMVDKEMDVPIASRIVDAVWDSGYYQKIIVVGQNNEVLLERKLNVKFYSVPEWFIEHFKLPVKESSAQIQSGWLQFGTVIVQSNPGFAYEQIWKTFIQSLRWLLLTAVVALILGGGLLFIILKPLRSVTKQAAAICNQQFVEEELPWTIDLRRVVDAMNKMSRRLKKIFEEQAKTTEALREQAFVNPVSKLGNRRYFDINFEHLLSEKDSTYSGIAILFEVFEFKQYNDKHGYEAGDDLLRQVAKNIDDYSKTIENRLISHLGGASFILICPNKAEEFGVASAQELAKTFSLMKGKGLCQEDNIIHMGLSHFSTAQSKTEVLSQLDMALRQAQSKGENSWHFLRAEKGTPTRGAREWDQVFTQVVEQNKIKLHFQPTKLLQHPELKVYEVLMRIQIDENPLLNAGRFMPMAERLNRVTDLDRVIVKNVLTLAQSKLQHANFSINISPSSLDNTQFIMWLLAELKRMGKDAQKIIIELPEYGVVRRVAAVREFFAHVSALGAKTSIDNYGKSFGSFAYLNNLRLDYLKIHGSFIRNIHENSDNQFFIRSLVEIARSLDILIIAESVETEEECSMLEQMKVDGLQGYYIGRPGDLI